MRWATLVSLALMACVGTARGYELDTHAHLSRKAVSHSTLSDPEYLKSLGLAYPADDPRQSLQNSRGERKTVVELIADGSRFEDGFNCLDGRPVNHFFDPQNDRPLTVLGRELGLRSPDWALEDRMEAAGQDYSLRDARDRFYEAMTLPEHLGGTVRRARLETSA
jgi:hypothetical protein